MKELKNLNSLNNKKLLVILPINKIKDVLLNECIFYLTKQTYPVDLLVLNNGLTDQDNDKLISILENSQITKNEKDKDGQLKPVVVKADNKLNYVIEKTEKTQFSSIFNEAFNYAVLNNYEYLSVIEQEDIVYPNWYQKFDEFSKIKTDYHAFMPINREIVNGNFIGFYNEACWSDGLAEIAGVFDLQLMLRFNCMNLTGAVINVNSLKEYSYLIEDTNLFNPIKENIKISYAYEFFLRMIYNDLKFFTIPRIGYERRIFASDGEVNEFSSKIPSNLTNISLEKGGMNQEEFKFWSDLAKKEYFFDEAREINLPDSVK